MPDCHPTKLNLAAAKSPTGGRTAFLFSPAILVAALITQWVGCQPSGDDPPQVLNQTFRGSGPIQAVGTVGMVCDLVRAVGGQHVQVTQMIGSGLDPHSFVPTSADVKQIKSADIVFYNGWMLEGKMAEVLRRVGRRKPVVPIAESLRVSQLISPGDDTGDEQTRQANQELERASPDTHAPANQRPANQTPANQPAVNRDVESHTWDPHVWMDVSAWSSCAAVVADRLASFDPSHRQDYQANLITLQEHLAKLHQYGKTVLASIPNDQRVLITSHDAFNYFGRAYDLEVMGVQGISTESEAGVRRINQLVDLLVDRKIQAVFTESSVDPSMIQALIEGARYRGHQVRQGRQLFSDAMGAGGTYRGTYIGMLDHNITTVARELGGRADPGGFQGKLNDPAGEVATPGEALHRSRP